jgi:uncharacterized protein YndB with AHSA1/START domain
MTDTASTTAPTRTLVIERELPHPPEKIWRALTQGSLIEQWLMANDFEASVGHRFTFRSTPVPGWNGIIDCEVKVVEPNIRLAYTWGSMGMESVVTFTLTPSAGGTQLRMEHSGFGADQDQAYKGASYGWKNFLGKLETVLGGLA